MSVYSQFNSSPTNPLAIEYITSSQVYTAKASGWVNFVTVGSGGGAKGGWAFNWANNGTTNSGAGASGGAGGLAIKSVYVQAGTSYTITIGAGGTGIQHYAGFNTNARAGSGSVTSVVGPGISLVVTGGQGGGSSGNTVNPGAGGSILNTTNTTYDYYTTGGTSNVNSPGGSSVGIYGDGKGATGGYGAGTGGGTGSTGNEPSNGYSNIVGRNFTRQLAGGIATSSNYCETTNLTAANSGVLSNCGGGGLAVSFAGNTQISITGGQGAVFAGGGQGSGASYTDNGADGYGQGVGGVGGRGGGGGSGYGYCSFYHYGGEDPGARAFGIGGAGGAGLVIVEYL